MPEVSFRQDPPQLDNQYDQDRVLGAYLRRFLPQEVRRAVEPALREMGELAGGELYVQQLAGRLQEPVLTRWDAWGARVDRVSETALWRRAQHLAAEYGLVATAYEGHYGRFARTVQFALAYLFHPSTDFFSCPLAMTDGAARTLLSSDNQALITRAVPRLTSRDPAQFWTSGQWMTETTGGSDVGRSQTVARRDQSGQWRLYGRKWFTSAVNAEMALTLARPEGNPQGSRGLALFYVELRDHKGHLNQIHVNRLKEKLGTRALPTAELELAGALAVPVAGLAGGVRQIVPMLHLTRTWNSVTAAAMMRRGMALALDYARRREAFGTTLDRQPLHVDTLAGLHAEAEAAFQLAFYVVDLIGREEAGELSDAERSLLRLLTSIVKLTTARQAVEGASEVIETFGGAGYVEDTGLPMLLRDSQVLPIWEGTTNVLALDALRTLAAEPEVLSSLQAKARTILHDGQHPSLLQAARLASDTITQASRWLERHAGQREALEAGARRLALTLGRGLALALLVEQAGWSLAAEGDRRPLAAALRFAQAPLNLLAEVDEHAAALMLDREPAA